MTKLCSLIFSLLLFCFACAAVGQAPAPKPSSKKAPKGVWSEQNHKGFCEHDSRPEILAFCDSLAELQTNVNAEKGNPGADLSHNNAQFTNALGNLDPTNPKSLADVITAVAAPFAAKSTVSDILRTAGQARLDRQIGPDSQANGTTSLVSKAGSSELIALALNAGVLTRSVNGATTTLSTNADQLFRLITLHDPDCIINCNGVTQFENKVLNPINISASFDVAQPNPTTTTTSGPANAVTPASVTSAAVPTGVGKLSNITVRYQMLNRFDPRGDKFKQAWKEQIPNLEKKVILVTDDSDAVSNILKTHAPYLLKPGERQKAAEPFQDKLVQAAAADPTGKALLKAFESFWDVTADARKDPALPAAVAKAIQDRAIYRDAWLAALHAAAGNLLTAEYSFNRPVQQPETHDLKLIYGYNFKDYGMLTFNGSASLYGTVPAGAKFGRLHYGQVSAQYDQNLSNTARALQAQMSLAGYWQYQPEPSVLNIPAGTVAPGTSIPVPNGTQVFVGTAGSLYVTQAKITLKGAGGIEVPIGVSWSNKTELLTGTKVGAQFGINYNFASLANLFGSSGQ
jgi:hypothetical protein